MPITDYRQQALDESRSFAERQREQKRQSAFVRQEMPGFAKANPQGFDVHAQGLYAALQSQRGIPAPGAQPAPSNMNAYRIRPDGSKQLQMLEQQSRGFDTAADVVLVFRRRTPDSARFDVELELTASDTLSTPLVPGWDIDLASLFAR